MAVHPLPRLHRQTAPQFVWQVYENEDDYRAAVQQVSPPSAARRHPRQPTWAALVVCLLVSWLLAIQLTGRARQGLDLLQQDLSLIVEADLWRAAHGPHEQPLTSSNRAARSEWDRQALRENTILQGLLAGDSLTATGMLLEMGNGWALVQVMTRPAPDLPIYRQTRVYAISGENWVRAFPLAVHWGSPQRLESTYFIFHYYTQDTAAVAEAAALLDARYPALYAAFFPEPPGSLKRVVEVTPEQMPGELVPCTAEAACITASPGVYFAPATVSGGTLVAQAVTLSLLDDLMAQAQARYAIPDYWLPMLDGVQLWQVWEADLPLSAWHDPLVELIYPVSPASDLAFAAAFGPSFCAEYRQWMASPMDIHVPLLCHMHAYNYVLLVWGEILVPPLDTAMTNAWVTPSGLQRLLTGRARLGDDTGTITATLYPGTAIAVATALEYAAATYGPQTVPALLAALAEHNSWQTLAPAVFGVSSGEFDAGWETYLRQTYLTGTAGNGRAPHVSRKLLVR